jgi:hypothetical protein
MLYGKIMCDDCQLLGIGFGQGRAWASLTAGVVMIAVVLVGSKTKPCLFQCVVISRREGLKGSP